MKSLEVDLAVCVPARLPKGRRNLTGFATSRLPSRVVDKAPDGSDVRPLLALEGGGFAHFELPSGETSIAVAHRTIEEIWYFVGGRGEMWREQDGREEIVSVDPGVCLTIPRGTKFQFRSCGYDALSAVAVTMPPWPGEGEAYAVDGIWEPTMELQENGGRTRART